jgi:hypothetical protein
MERWLKAPKAVVADPVKQEAQLVAAKAEMARVWATTANRDEMLKKIETWAAFTAPVEVRGCVPREALYPLMVEVYREKHPEDFAVAEPKPIVTGEGEIEP